MAPLTCSHRARLLSMLLCTVRTISLAVSAAALTAQEPAADPLAVPVLVQGGHSYDARRVLEALARHDRTLLAAVERDPDYRHLYLRSGRFLDQVHQFSNLQIVAAAGVPAVEQDLLLREAAAWAADHGSPLPATATLAAHGLEIEWRARLLALQPEDFGTSALRNHMLGSVPEFFCELSLSMIRVPLLDTADGSALPAAERKARYDYLDGLARRMQAGELSWEAAWDEVDARYGHPGGDRRRKGALGFVKRGDTRKFEEAFLRHSFADLGFKRLEGPVLRGPIMGEVGVYLARVESLLERGVVELERVRPQVERSLREKTLQAKLAELVAQAGERQFLAPVFVPE